MGQPAQPAQETTDNMMQGYIKNLDGLTQATTRNIQPTEQALLDAKKAIGPQQAQYDLEHMQRFLPQFTKLGLEQQSQQNMGQAANDAALLRGPGQDLVSANLEAQKLADPEYYATRAAASDQLARLMGTLDDPNGGLSATERAEIERSTARTNSQRGIESPTGTSAVESAMNFGSAGANRKNQKQQAINAAVQTAGQVMPALRSGVDVLQLTTGRPSQQNVGVMGMPNSGDVGKTSMNLGTQLMNQVGENSRQTADINSRKRTAFDTVNSVMQNASQMTSAI